MAKYTIDIPDEKIYAYVNEDKTFLRVPISAGENSIKSVFAPTMLRITPYTEPDEDEIRQKAHGEAWELFGVISDMDYDDYEHCFGEDCEDGKFYKLSYQEAKAKYDAWRKQKDEIHEYDEIISEVPDNKAVIVRIDCWGQWHCVNSDGIFMVEINQQGYWRKTGRSFPELGDVLKKMREE